jgi:integrase
MSTPVLPDIRHTALSDLAALGCDSFTLDKIAGHSSITITQRYCHPQADAIERAFANMADRHRLVTEGGHPDSSESEAA